MTVWILIVSLGFNQAMAFKNQDECREAAAGLKVPAVCVAFSADISDGKTL